jgi:HD superfamily phosphohydrolase
LGVAHLAAITTRAIKNNSKLETKMLDADCIDWVFAVSLAALYHDIGHGPFSHDYDHIIAKKGFSHDYTKHEMRSCRLLDFIYMDIKGETEINEETINLAKYFILPEITEYDIRIHTLVEKYQAEIKGIDQIVNNNEYYLDIDKLDYIMRDHDALFPGIQKNNPVLKMLDKVIVSNGHLRFELEDLPEISGIIYKRYNLYNEYYYDVDVQISAQLVAKLLDQLPDIFECAELKTREMANRYAELTDKYLVDLLLNSHDEETAAIMAQIIKSDTREYAYKMNLCGLDHKFSADKSSPLNMLPKIRYHQHGVNVIMVDNKAK